MDPRANSSPSRQAGRAGAADKQPTIGFAVRLIGGRAFLILSDRPFGCLLARHLSLEVPDLSFPFDVTGGAERFRHLHCNLQRLAVRLDAANVPELWQHERLRAIGIEQFELQCNQGYVVLRGFCSVAGDQVPFTGKATLLPTSDHHLQLLFYDCRFYGACGVSAAHLPALLYQALPPGIAEQISASMWRVAPTQWLLRTWLPPFGWKVPELSSAPYLTVQITPQGISLAAAEDIVMAEEESTPTPQAALFARDGTTIHRQAEQAIALGDTSTAYDRYRELYEEGDDSAFVMERLLQLGLSLPAWHQELGQLLHEQQQKHGEHAAYLHAQGLLAMANNNMTGAMAAFDKLAQLCRQQRDKWGALAAEMALGWAAEQVAPEVAIEAYRNAISKGAHAIRLFERVAALCEQQQDYPGVVWALEKWLHIASDVDEKAALHVRLGRLYLEAMPDEKRARVQFERALRLAPKQSMALEGLAEVYGRRQEPERAAMLLARLADLAETSASRSEQIAIQMRLARLWWFALHDGAHAIARLRQLLESFPNAWEATLLWAEIAFAEQHQQQGMALLEELVGHDEESDAPPAALLLQGYLLLATYAPDNRWQQGIASQWLLRSLELTASDVQQFQGQREQLVQLAFEHGHSKGMEQVWQALQAQIHEPGLLRQLQLRLAASALAAAQPWPVVLQHLQPALAQQLPEQQLLQLLGQALASYGEAGEIYQLLQQVIATLPTAEQQALAYEQVAAGMTVGATSWPLLSKLLLQVLHLAPNHEPAAQQLLSLAEQYGSLAQRQEALLLLAQASRGPAAAKARLAYVQLLGEEPDAQNQALRMLASALQEDSSDGAIWLEKARRELLLAQSKESLATLEQGLLHAQPAAQIAILRQLIEQTNQAPLRSQQLRYIAALASQGGAIAAWLQTWLYHVPVADEQAAAAQQQLAAWATKGLLSVGMQQLVAACLRYRSGDVAGGREDLLRLAKAALPEPNPGTIGTWWEPLTSLGGLDRCAAIGLQLQDAAGQLQQQLLPRQLQAAIAAKAEQLACQCAQTLLQWQPEHGEAHRWLASWSLQQAAYEQALSHGLRALQAEVGASKPDWWPGLWQSSLALSLSLASAHSQVLRQLAPERASPAPLHEQLAQAGRWPAWVSLQEARLAALPAAEQPPLARQLGLVLLEQLHQPEQALAPLQLALASNPTDEQVFALLIDIYSTLGRWERLAALYFTLAHMHPEPARSQQLALRSAQLYGERLSDRERALEALLFVASQTPVLLEAELCEQLRRYQADALLCEVLRRSCAERPDVDDGRWQEYIVLLAGPLGQPVQAWQLAQEMCLQAPAAQAPWQVQDTLLQQHPSLGDRQQLLRAWADARVGQERATLLMALAELYLGSGEIKGQLMALEQRRQIARTVLGEAIACDGQHVPLIERFSQLCVAQGDFTAAAVNYKTAIEHLPPGLERDSCIRSLLHVVSELQDNPQDALWALEKLHTASQAEQAWQLELWLEQGQWDKLVQNQHLLANLSLQRLWRAGELLAHHGQYAALEQILALLLADEQRHQQVWHTIPAWLPQARDKVVLGRFRLQWLLQHPLPQYAWLRLAAVADLIEGGEPPIGLTAASLEPICQQVVREDVHQVWSWIRAGRALQVRAWVEQGLAALLHYGPLERDKIYQATFALAELAFAERDYEQSLRLSQQLAAAGHGAAVGLLEQSLAALGRKEALLQMLHQQLANQQEYAPRLLGRIVVLETEAGSHGKAAQLLGKLAVADWDRDVAWAAWQLAWQSNQPQWAAAAAQVLAQAGQAPVAGQAVAPHLPGWLPKASLPERSDAVGWLRQAGWVLHWFFRHEPNTQAQGSQLLLQAQQQQPWSGERYVQLQAQLPSELQVWWLELALAGLAGAERIPVLLARMALAQSQEGTAQSPQWDLWRQDVWQCFAEHKQHASPQLWQQVIAIFEQAGMAEQVGQLLQQWYALAPDVAWPQYAAFLLPQGDGPALRAALEGQARRSQGNSAQQLWQQLARLQQTAGESELALASFEQAYLANFTIDALEAWLVYGASLGQSALLLQHGPTLLGQMPTASPNFVTVCRALITAQSEQGLDSTSWRQRLVAAGFGTYHDQLYLAERQLAQDPNGAAVALSQAAKQHTGLEKAELLERAAFAYTQAGQVEGALQAVEGALAAGGDGPALQRLVLVLPSSKANKIHALQRLVQHCAAGHPQTVSYSQQDKHDWIMQLAQSSIEQQDWPQAEQLLSQLLSEADGAWLVAFEQVLLAQDKQISLAWLWQQHYALLPAEQQCPKLLQAAACLASQGPGAMAAVQAALSTCLQLEPGNGPALRQLLALAQTTGWPAVDEQLLLHHLPLVKQQAERCQLLLQCLNLLQQPSHLALPERLEKLILAELGQQFEPELWQALWAWHGERPQPSHWLAALEAGQQAGKGSATPALQRALAAVARLLPPSNTALQYQLAQLQLEPSFEPALAYLHEHALALHSGELLWQAYQLLATGQQGATAAHWWQQAGLLAQTALQDKQRACQAFVAAAKLVPHMPYVEHAVASCVAIAAFEQAQFWLMQGQLPSALEWQFGQAILTGLTPGSEQARHLQAWLWPRHPHTIEAAQFGLSQARQQGEPGPILQAITNLLALPAQDLPAEQVHALRGEQVDLAVATEQWQLLLAIAPTLMAAEVSKQLHKQLYRTLVQLWLEPPVEWLPASMLALGQQQLTWLVQRSEQDQNHLGQWWLAAIYAEQANWPAAVACCVQIAAHYGKLLTPAQRAFGVKLCSQGQAPQALASWYERVASEQTGAEQGLSYWQAGLAWQQAQQLEQGLRCLREALLSLPNDLAKHEQLGLLLLQQAQPTLALPYLQRAVDLSAASTSLVLLDGLLACYRSSNQLEPAIAIAERCLQLAPDEPERWRELATWYGQGGHWQQERTAWLQMLRCGRDYVEQSECLRIQQRIATLAEQTGQREQALQDWLAALALDGTNRVTLAALAALYRQTGAQVEANEIAWQQLLLEPLSEPLAEQMVQVAQQMASLPAGLIRSREMLEQATEWFPRHPGLLQQLAESYSPTQERAPWLLAMERWIGIVGPSHIPPAHLRQCAQSYEQIDLHRAKDLWLAYLEQGSEPGLAEAHLAQIARQLGDMELYSHYEGLQLAQLPKSQERGQRSKVLGELLWQQGGLLGEALPWLQEACELLPPEQAPWQSLAQAYASQPATYRQAVMLYRQLLAANPLDLQLLRTTARLWRHLGEVDRTWQTYAALLCLDPADEEALPIVNAFRAEQTWQLTWPLEQLEQAKALQHSQQAGVAENLYIPLARLAERAVVPEQLATKGIGTNQRKDSKRADMAEVTQICQWFALPDLPVYAWPGRAYHVELYLGEPHALLIGELLWGEADNLARRFLVLRTLALYQSGYALPTSMDKTQVEGLLAALCSALLGPEVAIPYAKPVLSQAFAALLNPAVVAQCQPAAQAYLSQQQSIDIRRWQVASRSTANRLAMLLSCDVAAAVDTLFRMHGFEDLLASQRQALMQSAAEELDLFRFALSDAWFQLRSELQMAVTKWPNSLQAGSGALPLAST